MRSGTSPVLPRARCTGQIFRNDLAHCRGVQRATFHQKVASSKSSFPRERVNVNTPSLRVRYYGSSRKEDSAASKRVLIRELFPPPHPSNRILPRDLESADFQRRGFIKEQTNEELSELYLETGNSPLIFVCRDTFISIGKSNPRFHWPLKDLYFFSFR